METAEKSGTLPPKSRKRIQTYMKVAICTLGCKVNQYETQALEQELLHRINATNIGPQGFGGTVTALYVNIEQHPTHIAGLPVAVNIGCHVTRHAEAEL